MKNYSKFHNVGGWVFTILSVFCIAKFPAMSVEWLLGLIGFGFGLNLWTEARIDKLEEKMK